MRCTRKCDNNIVIYPRLHRILLVGVLFAYVVLALPLPFVVLDHELGLLTGDPTHTTLDDHAWLDHAAGTGLASGEADVIPIDSAVLCARFFSSHIQSSNGIGLSVRGPPDRSL